DDGYSEVAQEALAACGKRGITATCFASATPAFNGEPLWFDTWYSAVATGPSDAIRRRLIEWGGPTASVPQDWVGGEPRRWLAGLPVALRTSRLKELLEIVGPTTPPYL